MVLGKRTAGRETKDFLLPEIRSGVEISTLTLNVHTQPISEAGGKKKKAGMTSSEVEAYLRLRLSASSQPTRSE